MTQAYLVAPIILPSPAPARAKTTLPSVPASLQERQAQYEPIIRQFSQKFGVPGDIMVAIAKCESGFNPYRWNYLHDTNPDYYTAYGMFQVVKGHERTFGLSRMTLEGNIEIAMRLYLANGTSDWNESKYCWGK